MLNIDAHTITFSYEQPEAVLNPLLMVLQHGLTQSKTRTARKLPQLEACKVLIVDSQGERARYIARLLTSAGYQSLIASTALESYTRFLRGEFIPFVVIMGQDDANDRFFLQRLLQQMVQKYEWEIPLIRLLSTSPKTYLPSQQPLRAYQLSSQSLQPPQPQQLSPELSQPSRASLPQLPAPDVSLQAQNPQPLRVSQPLQPLESSPAFSPQAYPSFTLPQVSDELMTRITSPLAPLQQGKPSASPTPAPALPDELIVSPSSPQLSSVAEHIKKISLEGNSLGRYQILSLIGGTSLADVYKAYDRLREQDVALKVIQTNAIPYYLIKGSLEETNLFQQEVELLSRLDHPHILPLMNSGKAYISGYPFIYKTSMYAPEGSLANWLSTESGRNFLTPAEIISLVLHLADALQYAHDRQVTFQNFKMSNLLVKEKAKNVQGLHLMLADFSVAQDGASFSRTPDAFPYVAPEQWNGLSLPASDQYGLAALIYELLTRRPPFSASNEQLIKRMHLSMQPQAASDFNPSVSPFVDKVLLRALAKRPEERFDSVAVFAKTLQRYSS